MYQLFHEGEVALSVRNWKMPKDTVAWGHKGHDAQYLSKLRRLLAKMEPEERTLIMQMAQKVAR
jgi:hypothetical protein